MVRFFLNFFWSLQDSKERRNKQHSLETPVMLAHTCTHTCMLWLGPLSSSVSDPGPTVCAEACPSVQVTGVLRGLINHPALTVAATTGSRPRVRALRGTWLQEGEWLPAVGPEEVRAAGG